MYISVDLLFIFRKGVGQGKKSLQSNGVEGYVLQFIAFLIYRDFLSDLRSLYVSLF